MLMVFTGNGKGKTTMALGQAMRAVGTGSSVLMVQFIKGPWKSGEEVTALKLEPKFKLVKTGKGFVKILGDQLPFRDHVQAAQDGLEFARKEVLSKKWDMLILDEVNNALGLGLLEWKDVDAFLSEVDRFVKDIICTGRDAPPALIKRADLVTEMQEVKHPYQTGIKARVGVEF